MSDRRQRLAQASLYLVCHAAADEFLAGALRGGVQIVQLRCKHADDDAVLIAAPRFASLCEAHGALFILNDRPDLALRAEADGVHLGQGDMPVADARALLGGDRLIGLSTHTPEQIDACAELDVDYIGVGPVHATPTKPGRAAVGLELVRYASEHAQVPFFAIGGISPENLGDVVAAGGERVAAVRALTESANPESTARAMRRALGTGRISVGST